MRAYWVSHFFFAFLGCCTALLLCKLLHVSPVIASALPTFVVSAAVYVWKSRFSLWISTAFMSGSFAGAVNMHQWIDLYPKYTNWFTEAICLCIATGLIWLGIRILSDKFPRWTGEGLGGKLALAAPLALATVHFSVLALFGAGLVPLVPLVKSTNGPSLSDITGEYHCSWLDLPSIIGFLFVCICALIPSWVFTKKWPNLNEDARIPIITGFCCTLFGLVFTLRTAIGFRFFSLDDVWSGYAGLLIASSSSMILSSKKQIALAAFFYVLLVASFLNLRECMTSSRLLDDFLGPFVFLAVAVTALLGKCAARLRSVD